MDDKFCYSALGRVYYYKAPLLNILNSEDDFINLVEHLPEIDNLYNNLEWGEENFYIEPSYPIDKMCFKSPNKPS